MYSSCGDGGDAGGGGDALLSLPLVLFLGDIRLSKRKAIRGSYYWRVLLPLNPKGLLREAPRK